MGDGSGADSMQTSDIVEKMEPSRDGSSSDSASTPDPEPEAYSNNHPQEPQQQKRKGGRKPIYATSEERKQRNRQAQAAFRERRTEYIKQLESQIRDLTATKSQLKENHDKTADECLMLRYKNSLLEKILQEKGIDVRLELQEVSGSSPAINPVRNGPPAIAASPAQMPMQKAMMLNRQPQARWPANMQPKAEGVHGLPVLQPDGPFANRSPHLQPTATSQTSSPVAAPTRSPNFVPQGMIQSPNFGPISQQAQGLRQQPPVRPQAYTNQLNQAAAVVAAAAAAGTPPLRPTPAGLSRAPPSTMAATGGSANSGYYQANFQSHMDQLDQEYDAAADMIDDHDTPDHSAGPGPYPQSFGGAPQAVQRAAPPPPQMSPSGPLQPFASPASAHPADMSTGAAFFGAQNHLFDPFENNVDHNIDQDPFGLSASMHFPTQFTYESR